MDFGLSRFYYGPSWILQFRDHDVRSHRPGKVRDEFSNCEDFVCLLEGYGVLNLCLEIVFHVIYGDWQLSILLQLAFTSLTINQFYKVQKRIKCQNLL